MLRVAEGCELEDMLRQIRGAQSIDDYLDSVHDATLLLPFAGTARSTTNKAAKRPVQKQGPTRVIRRQQTKTFTDGLENKR